MTWFKRDKKAIEQSTPPEAPGAYRRTGVKHSPHHRFPQRFEENLFVCPKCQFHFKMDAKSASKCCWTDVTQNDAGMTSSDPLNFTDTKPYAARV
jgi:acetyl-CoA carboxylase carboxyl transferase subunit beta